MFGPRVQKFVCPCCGKQFCENTFSPFYYCKYPAYLILAALKLKGDGKMSSSDDFSFIAMTDSPKEVEKKIRKYAFSGGRDTIKEHKEKGGNPDKDVSFQYLKMFFEPNDKKLAEIEDKYRKGEMLTSELKEIAIKKINEFLKKHQKKMKKARKQVSKFL